MGRGADPIYIPDVGRRWVRLLSISLYCADSIPDPITSTMPAPDKQKMKSVNRNIGNKMSGSRGRVLVTGEKDRFNAAKTRGIGPATWCVYSSASV